MKITVVAMETPYPPIHGGRVDIWRRLQALSRIGVEIQLIFWHKGALPPDDQAEILTVVRDLQVLPMNGTTVNSLLRRVIYLPFYPLEVTSRLVYGRAFDRLLSTVKGFSPDVIMIDQLHGCMAARELCRELHIPLILRSHNIEHLYTKNLLKTAQGSSKIRRLLSLNKLEKIEKDTLKSCQAFYDISVDDLSYWQGLGFSHGRFLPPLAALPEPCHNSDLSSEVPAAETEYSPHQSRQLEEDHYDVVFLGNLNTENNVSGVSWFLQDVVPILQQARPQLKVLIAGSNPVTKIGQICDAIDCVTLKVNPKSAAEIYHSGQVLINPNAVGGGVSIKAIDMLAASRPIVTLASGIGGLPPQARQLFHVASDTQDFAEKILSCLNNETIDMPNQELIDQLFGIAAVKAFVEDLEANVIPAMAG